MNIWENAGLPLRKVAAYIDIDPSTLSKIEREERSVNKEKTNEILKVTEEKIRYFRGKNYQQGKLSFE